MIRRNSKLEQKFLPVLCFALPLSPASRLGKNSNLRKVFLPHLDVGLGSCLTWSNALFGAIFPMGFTFSLPKLSIKALIDFQRQKFVCTERVEMHLDVCSWSGLLTSLSSFFSTEPVAINLVEAFKERICQPVPCFTFSLCSAMRLYHKDKFSKKYDLKQITCM